MSKEANPTKTEVFNTADYNRSLREYEYYLEFSRKDLQGKTILDVGSGKELLFSREAREAGITVISMNPELGKDETMRKKLTKKLPWYRNKRLKAGVDEARSRTMAARAQAIPLQDESVDVITGLFSATSYIKDPEELKQAFDEMMRVLKPGGNAYFRHFDNWRGLGITNQIDKVNEAVEVFKEKGYMVDHKISKSRNNWAPFGLLKITKPKNS